LPAFRDVLPIAEIVLENGETCCVGALAPAICTACPGQIAEWHDRDIDRRQPADPPALFGVEPALPADGSAATKALAVILPGDGSSRARSVKSSGPSVD
jgi:hypothetical protein